MPHLNNLDRPFPNRVDHATPLLAFLTSWGGSGATFIAEQLNRDPQVVLKALGGLRRKGLVVSWWFDRTVIFALTEHAPCAEMLARPQPPAKVRCRRKPKLKPNSTHPDLLVQIDQTLTHFRKAS